MLTRIMAAWRTRWESAEVRRLQLENERLRDDLKAAQSECRLHEVEIEHLTRILARDRARVAAETRRFAAGKENESNALDSLLP